MAGTLSAAVVGYGASAGAIHGTEPGTGFSAHSVAGARF